MQKLMIAKTGDTKAEIKQEFGDFEEMFIDKIEFPRHRFMVIKPYGGEDLPDVKKIAEAEIAGLIITGSHAMVTDEKKWINRLISWTEDLLENTAIPVLGVCFGHQLLAAAAGGNVDYHSQGREIGTVPIRLTETAGDDPLLADLPAEFKSQAIHAQTVTGLPPEAVVLAENEYENCHAFRLNDRRIWGVQFHPEFTAGIMKKYIELIKDEIRQNGRNPEKIMEGIRKNPHGAELLNRFARIAFNQD